MRKPVIPLTDYIKNPRIVNRFWGYVDKSNGPNACWPWTGSTAKSGYGNFKVASYVSIRASRFAYAVTHKRDPGAMFTCHTCDNPPCCNPKHLWLGDTKANSHDMVKKGRNNTGPQDGHNNGNAKLSAEEVAKIKECILAGMNNKVIAEIFEITHSLVSLIRRGKLWGDVPLTKKYSSIIKQTTDNALEEK